MENTERRILKLFMRVVVSTCMREWVGVGGVGWGGVGWGGGGWGVFVFAEMCECVYLCVCAPTCVRIQTFRVRQASRNMGLFMDGEDCVSFSKCWTLLGDLKAKIRTQSILEVPS